DYFHLSAHQVRCKAWQPVVLAIAKTKFDRQIAALDIARLIKALAECSQHVFFCVCISRSETKPTYSAYRVLLRKRRERPCRRRSAEQSDDLAPPHSITPSRDELASPHSMTSSARASSISGTVRPSALAVLRLMTNS